MIIQEIQRKRLNMLNKNERPENIFMGHKEYEELLLNIGHLAPMGFNPNRSGYIELMGMRLFIVRKTSFPICIFETDFLNQALNQYTKLKKPSSVFVRKLDLDVTWNTPAIEQAEPPSAPEVINVSHIEVEKEILEAYIDAKLS